MNSAIRALVWTCSAAWAVHAHAADPDRSTLCFHPDTDPADRSAILRLDHVTRFDRRLNILTRPLDAAVAGQLRAGVESGRPTVQRWALTLVATALAQDAVPEEAIGDIARAATAVAESKEDSPASRDLRLYAQRVLWHLRVASDGEPADRAAFLAPYLEERGPDGPYLAYAAVDYLAETGADGERVLRSFIAESSKRSLDSEVVGRAELGVRKIELTRAVERVGPGEAVGILAAAARTETHRRMDCEFGIWVVGQLATRRPEAESELRV